MLQNRISKSSADQENEPHPIDVHVGAQLRRARLLAGLSQGQVASAAGISFQQLQKYERGVNRISASRLYEVASILRVPVSYFFDAIPGVNPGANIADAIPLEDQAPVGMDSGQTAGRREIIELVRAYMAIEQRSVRNAARSLLEELAKCTVAEAAA